MELGEIVKGIYEVKTVSELDAVFEAYRGRRRELSVREDSVAKVGLKVGDLVEFNARRRGVKQGIIKKMNPIKAQVKVEAAVPSLPPVVWNVPYSMLKKVELGG